MKRQMPSIELSVNNIKEQTEQIRKKREEYTDKFEELCKKTINQQINFAQNRDNEGFNEQGRYTSKNVLSPFDRQSKERKTPKTEQEILDSFTLDQNHPLYEQFAPAMKEVCENDFEYNAFGAKFADNEGNCSEVAAQRAANG